MLGKKGLNDIIKFDLVDVVSICLVNIFDLSWSGLLCRDNASLSAF